MSTIIKWHSSLRNERKFFLQLEEIDLPVFDKLRFKMAVCPYNRKKYERIFSYKNYYNERFEIACNQAEFHGPFLPVHSKFWYQSRPWIPERWIFKSKNLKTIQKVTHSENASSKMPFRPFYILIENIIWSCGQLQVQFIAQHAKGYSGALQRRGFIHNWWRHKRW